jgi:hypothetical protein
VLYCSPWSRSKIGSLEGKTGEEQAKKCPLGSGLNLFLEENRGDRFIMLHRTKSVQ